MAKQDQPFYAVAGAVLLYWCTSWAAVFMNKHVKLVISFICRWVYTNLKQSFDAPYFVTFVQFISPTVCLYLFSRFNKVVNVAPNYPDIVYRIMGLL